MHTLHTKIISIVFFFSISLSVQALEIGQVAPNFSLPSLTSDANRTLSQYRGQVVYVDFWASWCAPCRTSFPLLEKLYKTNKDKGFTLVAINMDEELVAVTQFLQMYPTSFELLRDAEGQWADAYGIETMPTSYIIDKKGVIRHIHNGFSKDDIVDIERIVKQLLNEN
ncbi:MAG: cytochrome c biogenesis protein CcmG, thiol:disulfide interchange protein DsbE [Methyloprofundus sp.]|nr:MAG: cytochrome c biogenesis protein CcmG, thiol:disulfide interchange protein DsbE [Methyloprofundus sp.]